VVDAPCGRRRDWHCRAVYCVPGTEKDGSVGVDDDYRKVFMVQMLGSSMFFATSAMHLAIIFLMSQRACYRPAARDGCSPHFAVRAATMNVAKDTSRARLRFPRRLCLPVGITAPRQFPRIPPAYPWPGQGRRRHPRTVCLQHSACDRFHSPATIVAADRTDRESGCRHLTGRCWT